MPDAAWVAGACRRGERMLLLPSAPAQLKLARWTPIHHGPTMWSSSTTLGTLVR